MEKKLAVITGSSSGIGAGLAEFLVKNDFACVITYNKHDFNAQELVKKLNKLSPESSAYHLDLRTEESIQHLAKEITVKFKKIDLLVCNAGVDYYHESFEEVSLHEWQEIFEVKVFGTYLCTKHFISLLKMSKNPNIIALSSSLAKKPDPADPAYSAACAAIDNLSISISKALGKHKIRTNVICPGPTDTNLQYWQEIKKKDPNIFTKFKSSNPLNISMEIEYIGDLILSIYNNSSLTGNIIYASGGSQLL